MWSDDFYDRINALFAQADKAALWKNRWLKFLYYSRLNSVKRHNQKFDFLNWQINSGRDAVTGFKRKLEERHERYCQKYRDALNRQFDDFFKKRDSERLKHAKQCVLEVHRAALAVGYPKTKLKTLCEEFFNKNISTETMDTLVEMIEQWLNDQ